MIPNCFAWMVFVVKKNVQYVSIVQRIRSILAIDEFERCVNLSEPSRVCFEATTNPHISLTSTLIRLALGKSRKQDEAFDILQSSLGEGIDFEIGMMVGDTHFVSTKSI